MDQKTIEIIMRRIKDAPENEIQNEIQSICNTITKLMPEIVEPINTLLKNAPTPKPKLMALLKQKTKVTILHSLTTVENQSYDKFLIVLFSLNKILTGMETTIDFGLFQLLTGSK